MTNFDSTKRYNISTATRHRPAYIIQSCSVLERSDRIRLLLGLHLETTLLALGLTYARKADAHRLHVKTDAPRGIQVGDLYPQDIYDAFGHVGGRINFRECVRSLAGEFSCAVEKTMKGEFEMTALQADKPTLVINRTRLFHKQIAPYLREEEADPHFGPVGLLPYTFSELVDKVRCAFGDSGFILID